MRITVTDCPQVIAPALSWLDTPAGERRVSPLVVARASHILRKCVNSSAQNTSSRRIQFLVSKDLKLVLPL